MIGVFDSGDGGLLTVEKIRELSPEADICFLADRENAPYGTKARGEIITLTKKCIKRLTEAGADKILIACCTASSVYPALSQKERELAVPIIDATARLALKQSRAKRIAVIATRATVNSGAFQKSLLANDRGTEVRCAEAQELVGLIEGGACDGNLRKKDIILIKKILSRLGDFPYDTLILGCTHFPRLEKTISALTGRLTVSSALAGAMEIVGYTRGGSGKNIFL